MTRSACKPKRRGRRGFTLIEMALAAACGTVLLVSLVYASNELRRSVAGVYDEAFLQTAVRDLQVGLDAEMPSRLAAISTQGGSQLQMTLDNNVTNDMTMRMGDYRLRYRKGSADVDGRLEASLDGVSWEPVLALGARGLLDQSYFAYADYVLSAQDHPPPGSIVYGLTPAVRAELVRVTTRMHKADMVPLYKQDVWAPRSLRWSWHASSVPSGGWIPNPGVGGLMPIALHESTLAGVTPGTHLPNIFNGGGPGNFGWLSWGGDGSSGYLAESINDPASKTYLNPRDPSDSHLHLGDWVHGNAGVSNSSNVRDALTPRLNQEVQVMVWNQSVAGGGNLEYNTIGYAKVRLTAFDLAAGTISAQFVGLVERDGTLILQPTPGPTYAPVATPSPEPVATPTPTPAPSTSPSPSPTPTPTPTPTPSPSATPHSDTLMPIGLHANVVASLAPNTTVGMLTAGTGASSFAWLTWAGTTGEGPLLASLALPGNSHTYRNPTTPSDTHIDAGDPIVGFTNIANNGTNRAAIDALAGTTIAVPLYNAVAGGQYTVSGFARVRVASPTLMNNPDRLDFHFVGYCDSSGTPI